MAELHPDAQRVLDLIRESGRPPYDEMEPAVARQFYRNARTVLQPEPPEVAAVRELLAPGPQGPIPLRLYRGLGTAASAALPALVFFMTASAEGSPMPRERPSSPSSTASPPSTNFRPQSTTRSRRCAG